MKNSAFPGRSDVSNSFMCHLHMYSVFIIASGRALHNAADCIESVVFLRNTASADLYAVIRAGKIL